MSTQYAILNNIDEDNNLVFETDKTEEELEAIVDSYLSGSGNNFQFDDNYFQDPTTIENDFMVVRQQVFDSTKGSFEDLNRTPSETLYQFIFNYNVQSREDLLDYNFNLSDDAVSDILDQSFEIIKDDFTSSPISFDYDFKFCEGGND